MQTPIPLQLVEVGEACTFLLNQIWGRRSISQVQVRMLLAIGSRCGQGNEGARETVGRLTVSELTQVMKIGRPNVSRVLKTLKARGYVQLGKEGGRQSGYCFTDEGSRLVSELEGDVREVDRLIRLALLDRQANFLGTHLPQMLTLIPRSAFLSAVEKRRLLERKLERS